MTANFPAHIEWLSEQITDDLTGTLERNGLKITCNQALDVFIRADPSKKKGAVDWIAKTYIVGGFRWEDIEGEENSKVYQTLTNFALFRKQLDGSAKNLSYYQRLSDVYSAIKDFIPVEPVDASARALKRKERDQAIAESNVLYRSNRLIVAVPLTEMASCWWGRGTQWCTAASTSANYFNYYNKNAPLIVALFPKGLSDQESDQNKVRKFQLWATADDIQSEGQLSFMDETDSPIPLEMIHNHWKQFKPLVQWTMEHNSQALKWFKPEAIDQEWLIGLIRSGEVSLDVVPNTVKNQAVCLEAVRSHSFNLAAVPNELITEEMCALVESWAWANLTVYLPEKFQVRERVFINLNRSLQAVKRLSLKHIEQADVLLLLEKKRNHNDLEIFLGYIQDQKPNLLGADVLMSFVQSCPLLISQIPNELKSLELCEFVMHANPVLITNVPVKYWNTNILKIAVDSNPYILNVVPENLITQEIVDAAIYSAREYTVDFSRINSKWLDRERYLKIASVSENLWKIIPEDLIDQAFCTQAFEMNENLILTIPEKFIKDKWWISVTLKERSLIEKMPEHLHTEQNYMNLVRNGSAGTCGFLKPQVISPDIAWAMIDSHPANIYFVPSELRTLEICERAVAYTSNLIELVPESLKSEILNRLAIPSEEFDSSFLQEESEKLERERTAYTLPVEPARWNVDILDTLKYLLEVNLEPQSEKISFTPE